MDMVNDSNSYQKTYDLMNLKTDEINAFNIELSLKKNLHHLNYL